MSDINIGLLAENQNLSEFEITENFSCVRFLDQNKERFELEFNLEKGTSFNTFFIKSHEELFIIHPPEKQYLNPFNKVFRDRYIDERNKIRESLKEMLFDNKKFKWDRLEDLLSNAAKQTNLDLEKLLDEVINLLFSPNGGFLRNEIVEGLTNQIDLLSLKILKSLNNYLPQSIKLNTINENNNLSDLIIYVEPLRNFLEILQKVPGYSIEIFLKRVPRLINEPYTKEMGIKIAKKVTEKGVVRLVKIAAGANI